MNSAAPALLFLFLASAPAIAASDELAGTSWRLVGISSVDAPEDPSKYTLTFEAGGKAAILADCNRGSGSWTSETGDRLSFGPIASTRVMCPPGSISDTYLSQFGSVRNYAIRDGNLVLATTTDGPVIEFTPVASTDASATVLGEEVRTSDAGELREIVLARLFDAYAADHAVKAEPAEIAAFVDQLEQGLAKDGLSSDGELSAEETKEVAALRHEMARSVIRQRKINKALHDQYGGRIIYQQLGPEPLDAYRRFLEQRQSEGAFTIHDQALAQQFWGYFTDESIHDFMAPGGEDEKRAFTEQPWGGKTGP